MLLSIIIPVYNAEKYLNECLDSLFDQDVPENEYEIICVNDGSKDRSAELVTQYMQIHGNIRLLHQPNSGVSVARNKGIETAAGEYIWFVDADDFIAPNVLRALMQIVLTEPCDCLLFENAYELVESLSEEERRKRQEGTLVSNHGYSGGLSVMRWISRAFLLKNNLKFYPGLRFGEDLLFNYEIEKRHPVISKTNLLVYFYRRNSGSVTNNREKYRSVNSDLLGARIMKRYYDQEANVGNVSPITGTVLMHFVRNAMISLAKYPGNSYKAPLVQFREEGLFPFVSPKNVLQKTTGMTGRTDFIGRIIDKLYMNCTTRCGFYRLRSYNWLMQSLKRGK